MIVPGSRRRPRMAAAFATLVAYSIKDLNRRHILVAVAAPPVLWGALTAGQSLLQGPANLQRLMLINLQQSASWIYPYTVLIGLTTALAVCRFDLDEGSLLPIYGAYISRPLYAAAKFTTTAIVAGLSGAWALGIYAGLCLAFAPLSTQEWHAFGMFAATAVSNAVLAASVTLAWRVYTNTTIATIFGALMLAAGFGVEAGMAFVQSTARAGVTSQSTLAAWRSVAPVLPHALYVPFTDTMRIVFFRASGIRLSTVPPPGAQAPSSALDVAWWLGDNAGCGALLALRMVRRQL